MTRLTACVLAGLTMAAAGCGDGTDNVAGPTATATATLDPGDTSCGPVPAPRTAASAAPPAPSAPGGELRLRAGKKRFSINPLQVRVATTITKGAGRVKGEYRTEGKDRFLVVRTRFENSGPGRLSAADAIRPRVVLVSGEASYALAEREYACRFLSISAAKLSRKTQRTIVQPAIPVPAGEEYVTEIVYAAPTPAAQLALRSVDGKTQLALPEPIGR